jgi:hypothetical protein
VSKKGFSDKPTKIQVRDSFEFNYGRYEVVELLNERWGNHERKYRVRFIDNGYEATVTPTNIKLGKIRNPFYKSVAGVGYLGNISHNHFLYNRWRSMISRCYSENDKDYIRYGAKGIYVSDEWHCFETYVNDVVNLKGYDEKRVKNNELNLDKDILSDENNRYYSFETCKWVTLLENNNEQFHRNGKYFECIRIEDGYKEITNSQMEFARKYGLNNDCITHCLKGRNQTHKGWKFSYIEEDISNILL